MVSRRLVIFSFFAAIFLDGLAHGQGLKPLVVAPKNMVAAPRDGRLLILLDLQPHRVELGKMAVDQAVSLMVATAEFYASQSLSSEQYHGEMHDAEVILAFVENMDEYNRPNFGGMVRLGSVKFHLDREKTQVIDVVIDKTAIKETK